VPGAPQQEDRVSDLDTESQQARDRLSAALADRYVIERELGHGGMAVVYLAEDLKHHRRVALKILRPVEEGHIYVERSDGTGLRQLTGDSAIDAVPRWSPDGSRIAFHSTRGPKLQLWSIRSDGSELRQLTDADSGVAYPVWSPDGARIVGSEVLKRGRSFIFDPAQPGKPEALPVPEASLQPVIAMTSWSADGRWLCGAIMPDNGILTYDLRTRRYERLTDYGEWPAWFPDSRHVLFVSGPGEAFYVLDRVTRQVRKVFAAGRDVIGPPRLTRDGRQVYYTRRATEADIWLMTLR
jgi:Tol biopolymer transport system component